MLRKSSNPSWSLLLLMWLLAAGSAFGQGTAFNYQGKLTDGSSPANGAYDFQFKLYDTVALGTGTQFGNAQTLTGVAVSSGIFTVQLDFGACPACFNGPPRFLEIAVRPTGGGSFTILGPRQPFTSAPYALRSQSAAAADGLSVSCVNCVTSSQIASVSGSAVSGAIPVASVPAGSASYIQNGTSPQASSNFNISGDGTLGGTLSANAVDAATQYNLGSSRVLSVAGSSNLFAGVDAGSSNTSGFSNSFVGREAGLSNETGSYNSFLGRSAGRSNIGGGGNAFVGLEAGFSNTTGGENAFFGTFAGWSNTTGNYNTMIGRGANVGYGGLSNATAVGSNALVGCSNCLVLGSINGVGGATADTYVGIGTTSPGAKLHVVGGGTGTAVAGSSTSGRGVAGYSTSGDGVYGSSASGYAGRFAGSAHVSGTLAVVTLGAAGSTTLCRNDLNQIATCSSSLRYKDQVRPFSGGLDILNRLRPIAFTWKRDGQRDLGLAAEEVEKVEPLLITHNDKGEVEGVKYDRVAVVLVNAVKEQQAQIEAQQREIAALKKLICLDHPEAEMCKP